MRFELTTLTLARLCSTPELRPLDGRRLASGFGGRKSPRAENVIQILPEAKGLPGPWPSILLPPKAKERAGAQACVDMPLRVGTRTPGLQSGGNAALLFVGMKQNIGRT